MAASESVESVSGGRISRRTLLLILDIARAIIKKKKSPYLQSSSAAVLRACLGTAEGIGVVGGSDVSRNADAGPWSGATLDMMLCGGRVVKAVQCHFHINSLCKTILFMASAFQIHNILRVDGRKRRSAFCSVILAR